MPKTASDAIVWGRSQIKNPKKSYYQLCLQFVRNCFGVSAMHADAKTAWAKAKKKHATSIVEDIPAGVPVFWSVGKYGHIALSTGNGNCLSNDILRKGRIDEVPIQAITRSWGAKLLGWSEDVNDVVVYTKAPAKPTPAPKPSAKTISLSGLINAARTDPSKKGTGTTNYAAVKPVEDALVKKGLLDRKLADGHFGTATKTAYGRWQRSLGYNGTAANGIPGKTSLTKLMTPLGYTVIA